MSTYKACSHTEHAQVGGVRGRYFVDGESRWEHCPIQQKLDTLSTKIALAEATTPTEKFKASRYPYTYAYDYLNAHPAQFGATRSRSEWAARVAAIFGTVGTAGKEAACTMLADAYLREHGLEKPPPEAPAPATTAAADPANPPRGEHR